MRLVCEVIGYILWWWVFSCRTTLFCLSLTTEANAWNDEYAYYGGAVNESEYYYYYENNSDESDCPRFCSCLSGTVIDCSRRSIESLAGSESIFSATIPTEASVLHLGFNNITSLPPITFSRDTVNRNLRHLYLQGNQIRSIHPDAFAALPNLTYLDLSDNRVSRLLQRCPTIPGAAIGAFTSSSPLSCYASVTEAAFLKSASRNLISLNLNSNRLAGIPRFVFASFSKLEVLRLSWNKIKWISPRAFLGLTRLKVLQLRSNHLNAVTLTRLGIALGQIGSQIPTSIQQTKKGRSSSMRKSGESTFCEGIVCTKTSGAEFRVEPLGNNHTNSLVELDLGDTGFTRICKIKTPLLKRLYLDLNHIMNIPHNSFHSLPKLELLHLGGNKIHHISGGVFSLQNSLKILDLSRNNLRGLKQAVFEGLQSLQSLRLNDNPYLSKLQHDVFSRLRSLRVLYLQNCNLTSLEMGCWIHSLRCLWLYGNPIDCTCEKSRDLLKIFQQDRALLPKPILDPFRSLSCGDDLDTWSYQSHVQTTCAQPTVMVGTEIRRIPPNYLNCWPESTEHLSSLLLSYNFKPTSFLRSWARSLCKTRSPKNRRSQRFAITAVPEAQPIVLHNSETGWQDFESMLETFAGGIETSKFVRADDGTNPDSADGGGSVTGSDSSENDAADHNIPTVEEEQDDEVVAQLYDDLMYSGDFTSDHQEYM